MKNILKDLRTAERASKWLLYFIFTKVRFLITVILCKNLRIRKEKCGFSVRIPPDVILCECFYNHAMWWVEYEFVKTFELLRTFISSWRPKIFFALKGVDLIWYSTDFQNAWQWTIVVVAEKNWVFTSGRNLADVPATRVSNNVFLKQTGHKVFAGYNLS